MEDNLFDDTENEILHKKAIEENKRADGRTMDELRDLYAQAGGFSSILHGSGIFYRGGTHVLSVLTFGGPEDRNMVDGLQIKAEKRFMHHYNFPPYSAGEVGRAWIYQSPRSRSRSVGGKSTCDGVALVWRISLHDAYCFRINGFKWFHFSSFDLRFDSCSYGWRSADHSASCWYCNGISCMRSDDKYKILTDIQGPEDHHGDMDFKIAGTREGVTAIQLDVKVEGVPIKILGEAMRQAKNAR